MHCWARNSKDQPQAPAKRNAPQVPADPEPGFARHGLAQASRPSADSALAASEIEDFKKSRRADRTGGTSRLIFGAICSQRVAEAQPLTCAGYRGGCGYRRGPKCETGELLVDQDGVPPSARDLARPNAQNWASGVEYFRKAASCAKTGSRTSYEPATLSRRKAAIREFRIA